MAIQSSDTKTSRDVSPASVEVSSSSEMNLETSLRPTSLAEYIGQSALKQHLGVAIESARIRNQTLEHVLFYGPPGLGKTSLSMILATEMQGSIKMTSGPAIEKQSDIVSLLTSLQSGDILFIDEIHRLRSNIEEILYSAMEDFHVDIMLGTGTGATSVKMDIPNFTLIGATTKLSSLSSPLRDRFGNVCKLDFYSEEELSQVVARTAKILELSFSSSVSMEIAMRSRGTPRIANRLTKIVRDYITVHGEKSLDSLDATFANMGIDNQGLDSLDQSLLRHISTTFAGGPVGLSTLASVIGEEEATIEDVIEPYLLKIGYIEKTPRGRKLTAAGAKYMLTKK